MCPNFGWNLNVSGKSARLLVATCHSVSAGRFWQIPLNRQKRSRNLGQNHREGREVQGARAVKRLCQAAVFPMQPFMRLAFRRSLCCSVAPLSEPLAFGWLARAGQRTTPRPNADAVLPERAQRPQWVGFVVRSSSTNAPFVQKRALRNSGTPLFAGEHSPVLHGRCEKRFRPRAGLLKPRSRTRSGREFHPLDSARKAG